MKQRVNTIKGKRLVYGGDTNTLTKDEILVTETPNGVQLKERTSNGTIKDLGGSGSSSKIEEKYYKIACDDTGFSFIGLAAIYNLFYRFPFEGTFLKSCVIQYRSEQLPLDVSKHIIDLASKNDYVVLTSVNIEQKIALYSTRNKEIIDFTISSYLPQAVIDMMIQTMQKEGVSDEEITTMISEFEKVSSQSIVEITKEEAESIVSKMIYPTYNLD